MADDAERRMNLLIDRLPVSVRKAVRWLLRPSSWWVRIPAGILLIVASFFWFLPILGIWMLPLGMILLAEDVPFSKRPVDRLLAWVERRHPAWLGLPAR